MKLIGEGTACQMTEAVLSASLLAVLYLLHSLFELLVYVGYSAITDTRGVFKPQICV